MLTDEMATSIAVALVQSRLDYANSLLFGISSSNIAKLQRAQNMAAHLILHKILHKTCNFSSSSLLQKLHTRIDFKIATLTYKTLSSGHPAYLRRLISLHQPARPLRSQYQHTLTIPRTNLTIGQRAFCYSSPTIWNSIPLTIRQAPSIDSFKRHLKTFYFTNPHQ
jgi:hypothetical protein